VSVDYFDLPVDQKKQNSAVSELTGGMTNLGYVRVEGVREYLKLRITDDAKLWPQLPERFKECFEEVFNDIKEISWNCFVALASDDRREEKEEKEEKEERVISKETVDAVAEFVEKKSSLSLIHYFETKEKMNNKEHNEKESDDGKEEKEEEERIDVCSLHRDTGILTCAVVSEIQGLEMFDIQEDGWIKIENLVGNQSKHYNPQKENEEEKEEEEENEEEEEESAPIVLVLFIGEKVPLYSGNCPKYKATPHRVFLPAKTERSSIVFLLDVAK